METECEQRPSAAEPELQQPELADEPMELQEPEQPAEKSVEPEAAEQVSRIPLFLPLNIHGCLNLWNWWGFYAGEGFVL